MNLTTLVTVNIFISIIAVVFSGVMIFIVMGIYKEYITASKEVANKVEEVKRTLAETVKTNVAKVDELAKEETLKKTVIDGTSDYGRLV